MPANRKYASTAERQAAYRRRCKAQGQTELAVKTATGMPSVPGYRRWEAMRRQAANLLEQVASEMETYYGQRSEAWQDSERAEAFADVMESVAGMASELRDLGAD